jgi:hypothetical protein
VWLLLLLQGAQKHLKENVMQSDNVSAHATKEDENPELAGELSIAGCNVFGRRDAFTTGGAVRLSHAGSHNPGLPSQQQSPQHMPSWPQC